MRPAQHDARVARALAVLALALPAVTGFALAQDSPPPATTPATSPTRVIGEQVGTAREIVPFGAAAEDGAVVAFAVGQTRGPTAEPPSSPTTPRQLEPERGRPPIDIELPNDVEGPLDPDDAPDGTSPKPTPAPQPLPTTPRLPTPTTPQPATTTPVPAPAPEPSTPPVNVLLVGTAASPDDPTAWRRTAPPLDATGEPLAPGSWRPAGPAVVRPSPPAAPDEPQRAATASAHAGEATPSGAAGLLIRLNRETPEAGVLARRSDGRFQLLPGVPAGLVAPAAQLANPDATADLAPFAVVDAPAPSELTTPPASGDSPASPRGRTGVLLVPPGGDGVLFWDGTAWSEEPFQDPSGAPAAPARTPVALAATPDGDAVALVHTTGGTEADRITLYRRLADRSGWRPMTLKDAPLLTGALPDGVTSVTPTERPGDPLTVAPGHWWVDVLVRRAGSSSVVPATIHLRPGPPKARVAPADPAATDPATTDPAAIDPAATDPVPTDPAPTTDPATTTPPTTTPATTTPDTAPTDPLVARATATFCVAPSAAADVTKTLDGGLCTGELPGGFPTGRGYRSQAFASVGAIPSGAAATTPTTSSPFGGRVITSPVVEPDAEGRSGASDEAARDASASGGYLRLQGTRFTLEGGLGENDAATGRTETAAFLSDQVGWTGGGRLVGRVMRGAAADAGLYSSTTPPLWDPAIDVALSPPSVPENDRGAIVLGHETIRRETWDDSRAASDYSVLWRISDDREQTVRAIAWTRRDRIAFVGTKGLFTIAATPPARSQGLLFIEPSSDGPVERITESADLDLTDIAVRSERGASPSDPELLDGWAVGRDGAAIRIVNDTYRRTELPAPLATADLRQVAFGGTQAYVASSAGPLVAKDGTLAVDQDLAAMIEADGRPPEVSTVAGLPDGAVIFDARYVRNGPDSPWERLPSPAEGDVIAVSLGRNGADPSRGVQSLRIFASIADQARPRIGEIETVDDYSSPTPTKRSFERTPIAGDGRLTELTPAGWVDRTRTPLRLGRHADLSAPQTPIQSIVTGPDGLGWAIGGTGSSSYDGEFSRPLEERRSTLIRIDDRRLTSATAPPTPDPAPADSPSPAPTTPATTESPTTPTTPAIAAGSGDSKPIKLLIGGHPACQESCTGREDQRPAPLANLQLALDASARLRARGEADAVVIGGGRGRSGEPGLSRAGAQAYAELLRSDPATPPVFPAIGSGDSDTDEERETFTEHVIAPLRPPTASQAQPGAPRLVDVGSADSPTTPLESPGAAYAFDVPGQTGGAARVVVVDNAVDGALRGTADGQQARWLTRVLEDAKAKGRAVVVVGAAPLDRPTNVEGAGQLLELLIAHDVAAYVSTNGSDDTDSTSFGHRERIRTIDTSSGELTLIHTSGLSHAMPAPAYSELARSEDDDLAGPLNDYSDGATMVELTVPAVAQGRRVDALSVPLHTGMAPSEAGDMIVGVAWPQRVLARSDSENGVRWTDPNNQGAGRQITAGDGIVGATPMPCRLWFERSDCGERLDLAGSYQVDDPSIALFVRGKMDRKSGNFEIVTKDGAPVEDPRSPVLCPLKTGTTGVSLTVAGQTIRWRIRVVQRPNGFPGPDGEKKCEFPWSNSDPAPKPSVKTAVPALPTPVTIPTAPTLEPGDSPNDRSKPPTPAAPVTRPLLVTPPLAALPQLAPPQAAPPVAPNPKPVQPPAPPAPPSGVTTQQVPSHSYGQVASPAAQAQIVGVQQAERRTEVAREGVDHQATIYEADPRPTIPVLLAGGALAVLLAGAGHLAGRRRALTRAAARRFLR